jgi:hypothetical protein
MIPALTTAASGPLADLERRILGSSVAVERARLADLAAAIELEETAPARA